MFSATFTQSTPPTSGDDSFRFKVKIPFDEEESSHDINKKKLEWLTWASPEEMKKFQHQARVESYRTILEKWSSMRCSSFTPRNWRQQKENEVLQHVSTYDPERVSNIANIFAEENPCGKNQYKKIQEFLAVIRMKTDNSKTGIPIGLLPHYPAGSSE